MSCCTIKEKTKSSSKHFDMLKNHFDSVEVIQFEKYQLLTLKDKAPAASNMDWVVWLDIKIANQAQNPNYKESKVVLLDSVCEKIYEWLELLRMPDTKTNVQLSLFGDEFEEETEEKMPETPKNDSGWGKYQQDCKRVQKNRLKKKYTFLELFNIKFYEYTGIDHRKELPTVEEFKEIYKRAILVGKNNPARYDEFWVDDKDYLRGEPLSDIELLHRLKSVIRIYLAPFVSYFRASYDMGYSEHSRNTKESEIDYRFYTNGVKIEHLWGLDYDKQDKAELPNYKSIFEDVELITWIRETLGIENSEYITDEEVLKYNIESYLNSMLWYGKEEYDWKSKIKTFRNYKEFYANFNAFLKSKNIDSNGGGSGYSVDGFSGWISREKEGEIVVRQYINDRITMNRSIDNLEPERTDEVVVYKLKGKEIYQKAFELFAKNENVKEMTIFDFLLAA